MPLVLAIKNHDSVVVATDTQTTAEGPSRFGQLIAMPNRAVILLAGNLEAVRHAVMDVVLPKIDAGMSAAGLAQILQAALTIELVPHLSELSGRVEAVVAGIDPIRHIEEPSLYYLDSAQDFYLKIVEGDAVAAGSTAAVTSLLAGHRFTDSSVEQLQVLAKECLAATKLRWPTALGGHIKIGVVTAKNTRFQQY